MTENTHGTSGAEDLPTTRREATVEPGADGNRRRNLIIAAAVGAVVILGVLAAALSGAFNGSEPAVTPSASTVTLVSPTPTIKPVARKPVSAFADALPSTVLEFAVTAITPQASLTDAGAIEGYRFDYSDGGSTVVKLDAGQWETPADATAAYTAMIKGDPVTASGSVDVGGKPAGAWTASTAADGTGTVTWTNGTALFQVTGPADTVQDFYQAFGL